MDSKFVERKKKVDTLLLKTEVDYTIKLLNPFYEDVTLKAFEISDDFIFHNFDNIEDELKYFLNNKIDYNIDTEKIIIVLEKAAYIDIFTSITVDMIKQLCKKISNDLKHLNTANIELSK